MPIDIGGYKYNSQMVDSQSYKVTPSSGLVVHLDAGKKESYPGSGTVWYDLTGNNNHGTLTNGPTFSNTNGGAIVFDGVDDYIVITNNSSLYMTSQMSILVWFSIPQNNLPYRQALVCKHYSEYEIGIYPDGGFHSYTRNGTGGAFPSYNEGIYSYNAQSTWTANAMYQVVWTLNGQSESAYLNGSLFATNGTYTKGNSGTDSQTNNLIIGSRFGTDLIFKGNIYKVMVYNRMLTPTETSDIYNIQKQRFGL